MRGVIAVPVLAVLTVVSLLAATPQQGSAPQPPPQLPGVFRGEVDLIRLDVSVLERDRRPITGLTASDFTVIEDGTPQTIGAFTEVNVPDLDSKPTAWMRHAGVDIATNDLVDQLGNGRPYAIVMDDWTISADDLFLVNGARAAGRELVSRLGPADVAAVIFVHEAGRTVDFTTDRIKLLDAINGFEGRRPRLEPDRWETTTTGPLNPLVPRAPATPWGPGGLGGAASRGDVAAPPKLECQQERPLLPTLEVAARRLAMVPNRRKSIVLITTGTPLREVERDRTTPRSQEIKGGGRGMVPSGGECAPVSITQMSQIYGIAEQANINIYTVDVSADQSFASTVVHSPRREFLEDVAAYTGGLVVGANGESIETSVDRVLTEAGSYYLIGYQSSNGAPDGKFRRIEVRVNRPYVIVRARNGYFAPTTGAERAQRVSDPSGLSAGSLWAAFATRDEEWARKAPSASSLAVTGLSAPTALPLRVSVVPVGLASTSGGRDMSVAVALSVRLPPTRTPVNETVTVIRQIYDANGRPGPPVATSQTLTVSPTTGDEQRYDVFQRLTLAPGRYQMRLNARSAVLGRDGTVLTVVDVPDVARAPVTLSGVVLGTVPRPDVPRTDALASVLPIVPTSARNFAPSDEIAAFFQVFQGNSSPVAPVTLNVRILDWHDQPVLDTTDTIGAEAFGDGRVARRQVALPLAQMTSGPYLLSITATRPGASPSRRDVVFRVR